MLADNSCDDVDWDAIFDNEDSTSTCDDDSACNTGDEENFSVRRNPHETFNSISRVWSVSK